MNKVVWTLDVDGSYAPEITKLTYNYIRRYANKIEADFQIITKRKFPDFPAAYEKLQIYKLGKNNDWNIYVDADTLIHPDFFDVTDHLHKNTVCHNANDMAGNRWRYDRFFRRDGRHIGSCNWFTVGSDWCIDLWKPLDDLTLEEALNNIFPIQSENTTGEIPPLHLLDDYTLSRNIAKFGLKFDTLINIKSRLNDKGTYLWHMYNVPTRKKIEDMKEVIKQWKI